uniref:Uncharacterized protein n=1 Tax=Panagrolaimus sp. ES5 TaxID=591445 RepID=A0AC34FRI8_9BILA
MTSTEKIRIDNSCQPFFAVLYLQVESESLDPPKTLQVFDKNQKLAYRLVDIAYPDVNSTFKRTKSRTRHSYFSNTTLNPSVNDMIGLVYEHFSGLLYIIYKTYENGDQTAKVDVYLMESNSSSKSLSNTYLYTNDVDSYFSDTEWSLDIYTKMIYYHKYEHSADHGFSVGKVYSIPYGSLTYYLKHGIRGNVVKEFGKNSTRREKVQVTNGLVYSTKINEEQSTRHLARLTGRSTVAAAFCDFTTPRSQDFFFVLTGWELCKLRDGRNATMENCEITIPEVCSSNDVGPQKSTRSGFLWAITLAIVINAIYYHKYEHSADHGFSVGKVYSIPYGSLTYYLKHGIRGNVEKEFAMDSSRREKVQVTNGLVYSTEINEEQSSRYLVSLHRNTGGAKCRFDTTRSQDFLFVLTGWELCKLRDGNDANMENCEIKIPEASSQNDVEPQKSTSSGFLWAITLAIIINAVILLIILCVLCKRKDVDKYDNGMYPTANKDPNGALLTPEEIFRRRRTTSTLTEF